MKTRLAFAALAALLIAAPAALAEEKPVRVDIDKIQKADDSVIKAPRAKDFIDPAKAKAPLAQGKDAVKFVDPSKSGVKSNTSIKADAFVDPSKTKIPTPKPAAAPPAPTSPPAVKALNDTKQPDATPVDGKAPKTAAPAPFADKNAKVPNSTVPVEPAAKPDLKDDVPAKAAAKAKADKAITQPDAPAPSADSTQPTTPQKSWRDYLPW